MPRDGDVALISEIGGVHSAMPGTLTLEDSQLENLSALGAGAISWTARRERDDSPDDLHRQLCQR